MRLLEVTLVRPVGAGEAAPLVSEQLALDEVRGDGADGNERFLAAAAQAKWMAWATTSFPVPVSPVMRTLASVGATLPTRL